MSKHAKTVKSRSDLEMAQEVMVPDAPVALGALPKGQIPNREGYREPVAVWREGSRLEQMMREDARARWVEKDDFERFYGHSSTK